MINFCPLASLALLSVIAVGALAAGRPRQERQLQQIQSPVLEVFMNLPSNLRTVQAFKSSLGIKPEKLINEAEVSSRQKRNTKARSVVNIRSFEIAQPVSFRPVTTQFQSQLKRSKRDAEAVDPSKDLPTLEKPEAEKLVSPLIRRDKFSEGMRPMPDAIRGPVYTTYPVKEFDVVDIDDPDDPRRRKSESSDAADDPARDKRTFLESGGENGEATTPLPFWKRKKENPPFITGRGGSIQKGNAYTPAQHRSGESARESHSLKNLDKSVQSNEISRSNQDNFYSATDRRTYSRQSDNVSPSTPKSVYDTIDYSGGKKNQIVGRAEFGRNNDDKKETLRDGRVTHEQYYNRQYQYNHPSVYDRSFYHPPHPYPYPEMIGRGVEYYHRTYDPTTGRIIYYANMPEHGRSFEPYHRNFYRPYFYDPYYRNYVPPYDYRFPSGFGRIDYMRTGRSSQAYSYPFPEKEKYPRDARFSGGFDKNASDLRNKTYIIYDAEERPKQFFRNPNLDGLSYSTVGSAPQVPFRNHPVSVPQEYFPPPVFPFRNQYQPSSPGWIFNRRPGPGLQESNSRPLNAPEVQLPLTAANRGEDLQKPKKS